MMVISNSLPSLEGGAGGGCQPQVLTVSPVAGTHPYPSLKGGEILMKEFASC
jgi:hypothetical protein